MGFKVGLAFQVGILRVSGGGIIGFTGFWKPKVGTLQVIWTFTGDWALKDLRFGFGLLGNRNWGALLEGTQG